MPSDLAPLGNRIETRRIALGTEPTINNHTRNSSHEHSFFLYLHIDPPSQKVLGFDLRQERVEGTPPRPLGLTRTEIYARPSRKSQYENLRALQRLLTDPPPLPRYRSKAAVERAHQSLDEFQAKLDTFPVRGMED